MRDNEFGWVNTIWSTELASCFKLYDPKAVIVALRKTYQIEVMG